MAPGLLRLAYGSRSTGQEGVGVALVPWIDSRVLDPVRLAEIHLLTELMIAANATAAPLPAETVDKVLRLRAGKARQHAMS